jgi:hypothetical protein
MRLYLENNQRKWTGGMAQAVEHLLCKVLISNSSPTKKRGEEK